jgi:hypothetical protein
LSQLAAMPDCLGMVSVVVDVVVSDADVDDETMPT